MMPQARQYICSKIVLFILIQKNPEKLLNL